MRIALAVLSVFAALQFGCGRPAPAPIVAVAAPVSTNGSKFKLQLRPAAFVEQPAETKMKAFTNHVAWEFKFVEFREDAMERIGLKELFAGRGEKNPLVQEEIERSPMVRLARGNTNVYLTLRSGGYAGIVSQIECSNLIAHLETSEGVDVLTPARVTTAGDRNALIQVTSAATVLVPGVGNGSQGIVTTNLDLGIMVNARAFEVTDESVGLEVAGRMEGFGGYSRDGKGAAPEFEVTVVGSRVKMGRDDVLLLGSPMRMRVTRWKEKVAYVGDVPVLGRFFTKSGSDTNFYRVVMIVRPRVKDN